MAEPSLEAEVTTRAAAAGIVLTPGEVTELAETLKSARGRADRLRAEIGADVEPATTFTVPRTHGA